LLVRVFGVCAVGGAYGNTSQAESK